MNFFCCYSQPYAADGNEQIRTFFDNLKTGLESGNPFPFSCHHEIALVNDPAGNVLFVAVLVMRGGSNDDSVNTGSRLKRWFAACGNPNEPFYETYPARGTIRRTLSMMGPTVYDVQEIFGKDAQGVDFHEGGSPKKKEKGSANRRKWWQVWK